MVGLIDDQIELGLDAEGLFEVTILDLIVFVYGFVGFYFVGADNTGEWFLTSGV